MWSRSASRVGGIFSTILLFFENNSRLHWLSTVQILALLYNKIINHSVTSWSSSLINCNDDALQTRIGLSFRKIVILKIRNWLNDKNFGILTIGIINFTRLVFYQNFQEMFLTLKYVAIFAGLFFHKFETYHKKVYTMLSINKALNLFAP